MKMPYGNEIREALLPHLMTRATKILWQAREVTGRTAIYGDRTIYLVRKERNFSDADFRKLDLSPFTDSC